MASSTRKKAGSVVEQSILEIYGSLTEEMRFEQTLHRLGGVFRSNLSALNTEDFGDGISRVSGTGDISMSEYLRAIEDYSGRFQGQNIWIERSLPDLKTRGYQHGDAVLSERELRQTEYYSHFLRPLDIRFGMGILLWSTNPMDAVVASFHRGHGEVSFDDEDMAFAHAVRPHLANAYAIYRRIARLERRVDSLRAGFDGSPLGMVVLDAAGRVIEINDRAQQCLVDGRYAAIGADRALLFSNAQVRQQFAAALAGFSRPSAMPVALPLRNGSGPATPIVLHVCRAPSGSISGFDHRAQVLVFVAELQRDQQTPWAESILRAALGLSRAEARVAVALLQHPDVAATAAKLGLSVDTVRKHVKSIHARLGVHRTSDMLVILDRLLGSRPAE